MSDLDLYPKYLTKTQLLAALEQVPDDAILCVNTVGNLSVCMNEDAQVAYLGYIDFMYGVYEGY